MSLDKSGLAVFTVDVAVSVSSLEESNRLVEILSESSTVAGRDQSKGGIEVIHISPAQADFGVLDSTFWVGFVLSIPVGVTTGIVANWLFQSVQASRDRRQAGSPVVVTIRVGGLSVEIVGAEPHDIRRLTRTFAEALKGTTPDSRGKAR